MSSLLTGLVSYYQMQGNGNDVLGTNNCTTTTNVSFSLANGKIQQGVGITWSPLSVLTTSSLVGFPTGPAVRTECFWVKTTSPDIMVFMPYGTDIGGGPPNQDFAPLIFAGNFGVGLGAGGSSTFFTGFAVNDGNWHFIAITYDGSIIRVYIDNVFRGQSASVSLDTIPTTLKFQAYQFAGAIDEVGFWNRVLTLTELTTLYNSGSGLTYPFLTTQPTNAGILFNLL